jgi:hypothetical protein
MDEFHFWFVKIERKHKTYCVYLKYATFIGPYSKRQALIVASILERTLFTGNSKCALMN